MRKNTSDKWEFTEGRTPENQLSKKQSPLRRNNEFYNEAVGVAELESGHIQQLLENIPGVVIEYESRNDGTHHYRIWGKGVSYF
jgi:hypothetical protein